MTDMPTAIAAPGLGPGKGWYAAAGAVAVATVAAVVALVAWFVLTLDQGEQFIGPGRHTATFTTPGSYIVWNDYRTVFGGRSYDESEKLPSGVQVTVRDADGGQPLAVSPSLNMSSDMGKASRRSIASFEIKHPGRYEIVVDGDFPARVFSASKDFLFSLLAVIFGALALLFLGFGVAIGILCWVFIKREAARAPATGATRAVGATAPAGAPVGLDADTKANKDITRIVYILQLVSLAAGITFIAAVILNYVKRKDVEGTWLESHFRWQIRTFWYCLLWTFVGLATLLILIGFFVLIANVIWMLYRAIKGLSHLEENKPMPL